MKFWCLLFLVFITGHLLAQPPLQEVKGLPSKEVYDLLIDKKGFLWVAHELGLSRYDGNVFKHYSHPQQASISMTDLLEDAQGRIWCHNFSSQVFYIENEQMHLLKAYDHTKETQFPRMTLLGDEVIVTSEHGLFVCNTKTFQARYVTDPNSKNNTTYSLTVLGNKVVAFSGIKWFLYDGGNYLQPLAQEKNFVKAGNTQVILPSSLNDTIPLMINPEGFLHKLLLSQNKVRVVASQKMPGFINGITRDADDIWINTQTKSTTIDGRQEIEGYNISDIATDKNGNRWVGSLQRGLLVQYKTPLWKKVNVKSIDENDFVRSVNRYNGGLLLGTQNGELVYQAVPLESASWKMSLPKNVGAVEFIERLNENYYLISSSAKTIILNSHNKQVFSSYTVGTIKDVAVVGNHLFLAAPIALFCFPSPTVKVDTAQWQKDVQQQFPVLKQYYVAAGAHFNIPERTKAVAFSKEQQKLFVAFKNGLYEISGAQMKPVLFNNETIYPSSLEYINGKLFVGTMNNGLLIKHNGKTKRLTIEDGLSSNSILKLKAINNHLWVFEGNAVQVLDIATERVLADVDLPSIGGSNAFDVTEVNNNAYLTTEDGMFQIPMTSSFNTASLKSYINYVSVNNTDTLTARHHLPYYKNNVHFSLSIPWYNPSQIVHFKYRLRGSNNNETWQTAEGAAQEISFASLMPGEYTFEAFAMVNGIAEKKGHTFEFTINRPWWQQWWFAALAVLLVFLTTYLLYRFRVRQLVKMEAMRRNISSDLHDDIGSTLSSINIYSELAKHDSNNREYVQAIQDNSKEIITKLDDLVWSINPKNDSLEQLMNRMRLFAEPILSAAGIRCHFQYNPEIAKQRLSINKKRNMYLVFKETINNVVKHSGAQNCSIKLDCRGSLVYLDIKDDGAGFDLTNRKSGRNGIENILERSKQINAQVNISSNNGRGTHVQMSVPA